MQEKENGYRFLPMHYQGSRGEKTDTLVLYSVKNIRFFSSESVTVSGDGGAVSITGEGLYLRSFSEGSIEIDGRISGIEFDRSGKNYVCPEEKR